MKPMPCKKCKAPAVLRPTAIGWMVVCTYCGTHTDRDRPIGRCTAMEIWNKMQIAENPR